MVTAARDRLARTLRDDVEAAFSVGFTARMDDLSLAVEGFGPVRFPVTPAKARKLASLGQPARFGRGEQTLTDPTGTADMGLRRRIGPTAVGGGSATRPVRRIARHGQRWHGGGATAA